LIWKPWVESCIFIDCIDFLLTGLKLVEYGEEEDEDFTGESPSQPSYSNGKPFWAT
jgi:hypothetical protein